MSTLQEFLIKKAEMKDDLWGLGAGGVAGSLGGLYAGNRVFMQKLKPHKQFLDSIADANAKYSDDLRKIIYHKNFDKLSTFHRLLKKDPIEAAKYTTNIPGGILSDTIRENARLLNRPDIKQEELDKAKRTLQRLADTMVANKTAEMHVIARRLGLTKDHADTLMNYIKYSNKVDKINKILKPAAKRLRGIGLLSGLLAGSGAGLGISRLMSD